MMYRVVSCLALTALGCLAVGIPHARAGSLEQRWKQVAGAYQGCFVLYDLSAKRFVYTSDKASCQRRYTPCSTFKIPNALIALETKVVRSTTTTFRWDRKKRFVREWNRSHDLASAIRYSVVWVFQEIAQRIGPKRMQQWLDKLAYGNQTRSSKIRQFWLDGSLRISPIEQIKFLHELYAQKLPMRGDVQRQVRQMLVLNTSKQETFSGKTGSQWIKGKWTLGWFVGHLRKGKRTYLFATLIYGGPKPYGPLARKMTRKMLKGL